MRQLVPELVKMLARGHTMDSVAAALAARGMQISARTISREVSAHRGRMTSRRAKGKGGQMTAKID